MLNSVFSFYDLFIFTDHLPHTAVVMMSAAIDLRGWQQTFMLTAVTKKKQWNMGLALYLARACSEKVGASLLISGASLK